ncbi:DUF1330 domain-containing protein [Streptomyces sp. NPDC046866]|uniref:DUF1330 domain-containing protein n=1 Tax=Streptomyces sp. NPDC046866 TaxID=3154921 RepID=UPI003454A9E8
MIDLDIHEPDGFQRYADAVSPPMRAEAGCPNLVVDQAPVVLEGDWRPSTPVIHAFPDRAAAHAFWDAPAYQPLKALRGKHSSVRVVGAAG